MNKQIVEYDMLRVITLCLVVLGHCDYYDIVTDYGGMHSFINTLDPSLMSLILYKITRCIYTFHMPLFMALSGALWYITVKKGKADSFSFVINNKFKRLIIPMLLTAVLWSIPLKYLSGYWEESGGSTLKNIVLGQLLMYGHYNSHLWFLQALFWCFILSWVIEKITPTNRSIPLFCVFLIILSCIGIKMQQMGICLLNITTALQYLLWFYVGFYFESKRSVVNVFLSRHHNASIISIVLFLFSWIISLYIPSFINPLFYFINALLGMLCTYTISFSLTKNINLSESKFIVVLSTASLGIYLFSDPLNYPIIKLVTHNDSFLQLVRTNIGSLVMFLLRFVLTFIGALTIEILLNYKKYVKKI